MLSYFHRISFFVWTAENSDLNMLRVDAKIFEKGGTILRFQKYQDSVDKAFKYTWILLWIVIMLDEMS